MELTKEYFEEQLKQLATKQDIAALDSSLGEKIDELARMVAAGFEDMHERLDVTERVQQMERKFSKIEEALHIKLKK